jgi:hypothetical protein
VNDSTVHITVAMPAKTYDKLFEQSRAARCSVPAVIRRAVTAAAQRDAARRARDD